MFRYFLFYLAIQNVFSHELHHVNPISDLSKQASNIASNIASNAAKVPSDLLNTGSEVVRSGISNIASAVTKVPSDVSNLMSGVIESQPLKKLKREAYEFGRDLTERERNIQQVSKIKRIPYRQKNNPVYYNDDDNFRVIRRFVRDVEPSLNSTDVVNQTEQISASRITKEKPDLLCITREFEAERTIIANLHGYSYVPASRAYLCNQHINRNCGNIQWEPQSVEAPKGFPLHGPMNKELASAGSRFRELDEYGKSRWIFNDYLVKLEDNHYVLPIKWFLSAVHRNTNFRVYISKDEANEEVPLSRDLFNLVNYCEDGYYGEIPVGSEYFAHCKVPKERLQHLVNKKLFLYLIWDIADTVNAFYQLADVTLKVDSLVDVADSRPMKYI